MRAFSAPPRQAKSSTRTPAKTDSAAVEQQQQRIEVAVQWKLEHQHQYERVWLEY